MTKRFLQLYVSKTEYGACTLLNNTIRYSSTKTESIEKQTTNVICTSNASPSKLMRAIKRLKFLVAAKFDLFLEIL